jgi:ferredoxin-type protein NapH
MRRYCASSQLQTSFTGFSIPSTLQYWHSGAIMTVGAWLLIGGIFWQGGRGWCLYGCPLGAVSNIFHVIGSKLRFTFKVKHDPAKCTECHKCETVCPSWSLTRHSKEVDINRHTCTACLECVKACNKDVIAIREVDKMERILPGIKSWAKEKYGK